MPDPPPLRRVHSDRVLETGRGRLSLTFWRKQSTARIVQSLKRRSVDATYQEYLKVKPDGTVMQGNTRIKILQERGYNVNALPRFDPDLEA